jgi:N-hydroxyarylamine O-acetyltransferase
MSDLNLYFQRIHYTGAPAKDYATLAAIHHQHLMHIPYENGDVQLSVALDFNFERIFEKLVINKRGGWCYEMNGLLAWALEEIGFEVRRMSGAVGREADGDVQRGNHLVLEVMVDGKPFLADVGLGDGLRFPIEIAAGKHKQAGLDYALTKLDDGFWRLHNHEFSSVSSFDFRHDLADESELTDKCQWLQKDHTSPFKMLLIVNRFTTDTIEVQLGKIHTTITTGGKSSRTLETPEEFHTNLQEVFGLGLDLTSIWPEIEAAHTKYLS